MANRLTIVGALLLAAGCARHERNEAKYSPAYGYAGTPTYSSSSATATQPTTSQSTTPSQGTAATSQSTQPTSDRTDQRIYHDAKPETSTSETGNLSTQSTTQTGATSTQPTTADTTQPSATSTNFTQSSSTPSSSTPLAGETTTNSATSSTSGFATSSTNQTSSTAQSQDLTPTSQRPDASSRIYSTNETATSQGAGDVFATVIQATSDADQSLGRQIIQELRTDTSLASTIPMLKIKVDSGKVTLTGTVKSQDEKQKIETAVQRATGVSSVDNQLQVSTNASGTDANSTK